LEVENFIKAFESTGKFLFSLFEDVNSMYAATFLLTLLLLYALILALIGRSPGFGDGKKANKYGKALAFVIALTSTFSMFRLGADRTAQEIVVRTLTTYGIFAGAVLAFLFFAILYFGLGNKEEGRWHLAIIGSGLAMAVVGFIVSLGMVQALGWLIGIIGLILYISSAGLLSEVTDKKD